MLEGLAFSLRLCGFTAMVEGGDGKTEPKRGRVCFAMVSVDQVTRGLGLRLLTVRTTPLNPLSDGPLYPVGLASPSPSLAAMALTTVSRQGQVRDFGGAPVLPGRGGGEANRLSLHHPLYVLAHSV